MSGQTQYSDFVREWFRRFAADDIAYPPVYDAKNIVRFIRELRELKAMKPKLGVVSCWSIHYHEPGPNDVIYIGCEGKKHDFSIVFAFGDASLGAWRYRKNGESTIGNIDLIRSTDAYDMFRSLFANLPTADAWKTEAVFKTLAVDNTTGVTVFRLAKKVAKTRLSGDINVAVPKYVILGPTVSYVVRKVDGEIIIGKVKGRANAILRMAFGLA